MSGQHSMLGDMKTRLCLHLEILSERCVDQCGDFAHRMRRPLLALSGIALFLTMRSAQKSIKVTKATGLYNQNGYSAPYDMPGGGAPGFGGAPPPAKPGGFLSFLTGKLSGSSSYGAQPGYGGGGYGAAAGGAGYGAAGYGAAGGSFGGASTAVSSGPISTADLCSVHCHSWSVHAAPGDVTKLFTNYGGKPSFGGEIVAVTTRDNVTPIQHALAEPGQGRVLVIDGGGGRRGSRTAIFDADLAQMATNNGWAGVLVNGCVRQTSKLKSMSSLGVVALCTSPKRGDGHSLGSMLKSFTGGKHSHVSFASLKFHARHFVYVDDDGILTSPAALSAAPPGGGAGFPSGYGSGGASTYGSGGSTYGSGSSTYGSSSGSSYGGGGSTYGSSGSTYGSGSGSTYGSSSGGYGSGTSTYGSSSTGSSTYGSGSSTYGSGGGSTYGSGSSTYGSTGGSTYGSTGSGSTYGSSGSGSTYGSGTSTYGSGSSTYGSGGGSSTYGSGGSSTYGGSGSSTYGSSGTSTYGSGSSSTYGTGTSTYGASSGGGGSTYGSSTYGGGGSTGTGTGYGSFGGRRNLRGQDGHVPELEEDQARI